MPKTHQILKDLGINLSIRAFAENPSYLMCISSDYTIFISAPFRFSLSHKVVKDLMFLFKVCPVFLCKFSVPVRVKFVTVVTYIVLLL